MQTDRKDLRCLQSLPTSPPGNNGFEQDLRKRASGRMDKGDVHPKKGLFRKTQGFRLLGKKEDQRSDRRSIKVVSQEEKTEAKATNSQ